MNVDPNIFENFISLGWYCGTASSMGKHGLRSYSYPFDWVSSLDFGEVIRQIETGFSDFLLKENLEQISVTTFRDVKYSMIFPHDMETNLKKDYDKIYGKYQRRIERFKCSIEKPTCFIRAVLDDNEAGYIQNHYEHIQKIIKKSNSENKIIFLLLAGGKKIVGLDCCYTVGMDDWKNDWSSMRNIFDSAEGFLEYCKIHLEEKEYKKNLEFDQRKCDIKEEAENLKKKVLEIVQEKKKVQKMLIEKFPGIQNGIIIFGTGFYGKKLTEIFQMNDIPVVAYADNDSKKWNTMQNGIPVLNPDKLKDVKGNILVTVSKREDSIIEQLREFKNDEINLIKLRELIFSL